ncbi:Ion channel [Frankineae bacterium MT45]|nr:Ion channel [Frankineae bacterium MT45]
MASDGLRPRLRRILVELYDPGRYGLVLLLILLTYALSVSLSQNWAASVVLAVQIATVWLILHTSQARRGLQLFADVALIVAVVAAIVGLFLQRDTGQKYLPAISGLLYLVAPFSIARHLIRRQVIDRETVLGSLATYLLIGMCFAFVYRTVGASQTVPFFGDQGHGTFPEDLFFSFTTLTTTGYGNLVPAGNPGQTLAVAEMLIGQLFLVTAVAKIINSFRPLHRSQESPTVSDEQR